MLDSNQRPLGCVPNALTSELMTLIEDGGRALISCLRKVPQVANLVLPPVQLSDVNSLANQHLAFTIIEAGWAAPQLTTYIATRFNLLGITQRELHP